MNKLHQEILLLNRDERLQLIQYIANSLRYEGLASADHELSDDQATELEKRVRSVEDGSAGFVSWEEIQAQLGKP